MYYFVISDDTIKGFFQSDVPPGSGVAAPDEFVPEEFDLWVLQGGVPLKNPAAALERMKLDKIKSIRAHFDAVMDAVRSEVARYEIETWDTQRDELSRYLADPSAPTPYVDSLAAARGETRDTLFPKIQGKVQQLAAIQGAQQALEKQAEAAKTIEELESITW